MDPIELFKTIRGNDHEFRNIDGEWFYKHKTYPSGDFRAFNRDRQFLQIKECIEARKTRNGLFSCQCGVCQAYITHKLYEAVVMEKKTDSSTTTEPSDTPPISQQSAPNPEFYNIKRKVFSGMVAETRNVCPTKSEPSVTPPPPSTGTRMLGFGKYSGQTFEHVYATDRKYCIWCIEKAAQDKMTGGISDMFQEFVSYVKGRFMEK